MKIDNFFRSIAFPFRIQRSLPYFLEYESSNSLFDQPDYQHRNQGFWESIDDEGWRTCKAGYAIFSKKIPGESNRFLVIHGLKVKPHWTQRGRTGGTSVVLEMMQIERYATGIAADYQALIQGLDFEIDSRTKAIATENVHEIRSMNTSLYHAGLELQDQLMYDKHKLSLAKNIVALSELVSARIELADLAAAGFDTASPHYTPPIPVYRRFDKIVKCYIAYASKREITFTLVGDSRSSTKGIEHFEMIPLIVVDNAVKYSPNKRSVDVTFQETANSINVEIRSLGSKIEPHEYDKIFDREFRGTHAISSGSEGSGIGLYFAKKLMTAIGATIFVSQETTVVNIQARQYFPTTFKLIFEKIQPRGQ